VVSLGSWELRRSGDADPDPALRRAATPADAVEWVMLRAS